MELINAKSLFQPAAGFIRRAGFDFTCNPYVGCTFGCTYCYAMFLPQNRRPREEWGRWLKAKQNAVELAREHGPKVAGKAVYLSSVTDPYLPSEQSLLLTRGILEELVVHQPRLAVQTRGPLVVRDVDLLKQFRRVRVNLSIPTDSEAVWRAFEAKSPRLEQRWAAAAELRAAGVPVGLCVTPLLPLDDEWAFVDRVARFQPDAFVLQGFHAAAGAFGADTGPTARALLDETRWGPADYARVRQRFRERIGAVPEAEAGFAPP
jgi:DNA repair photolyase